MPLNATSTLNCAEFRLARQCGRAVRYNWSTWTKLSPIESIGWKPPTNYADSCHRRKGNTVNPDWIGKRRLSGRRCQVGELFDKLHSSISLIQEAYGINHSHSLLYFWMNNHATIRRFGSKKADNLEAHYRSSIERRKETPDKMAHVNRTNHAANYQIAVCIL